MTAGRMRGPTHPASIPRPQTAGNTRVGNLRRPGAGGGGSIRERLHLVRDPRVERARRHEPRDAPVVATRAAICGAEGRSETEEPVRSNEDGLKAFPDLPRGRAGRREAGRGRGCLPGVLQGNWARMPRARGAPLQRGRPLTCLPEMVRLHDVGTLS